MVQKASGVKDFVKEIKETTEKLKISLDNNSNIEEIDIKTKKKRSKIKNENVQVSPKLNFLIGMYYKGTGIEEVLKKLEKGLDEAPKNESAITIL